MCAGSAFSLIVISTYGFVAEPVAWQIVILRGAPSPSGSQYCQYGSHGLGGVVTPGQPAAGAGMMSRPSWCAMCAGSAFSLIVISTYGFVADPVAWQMVIFFAADPSGSQ